MWRRRNAFSQFIECFRQPLLHLRLLGAQGSAGAFTHHTPFGAAEPREKSGGGVQYRSEDSAIGQMIDGKGDRARILAYGIELFKNQKLAKPGYGLVTRGGRGVGQGWLPSGAKKASEINSRYPMGYFWAIVAECGLGNRLEAEAQFDRLKQILPHLLPDDLPNVFNYFPKRLQDRISATLRGAGFITSAECGAGTNARV